MSLSLLIGPSRYSSKAPDTFDTSQIEVYETPATFYLDPLFHYGLSLDLDALAGLLHFASGVTQENTVMANGTVKWFNTTKGYGFIAPDNGGKDVFVHISAVERSGLTGLADNQKVTYDLASGRDGRESAENLALV